MIKEKHVKKIIIYIIHTVSLVIICLLLLPVVSIGYYYYYTGHWIKKEPIVPH